VEGFRPWQGKRYSNRKSGLQYSHRIDRGEFFSPDHGSVWQSKQGLFITAELLLKKLFSLFLGLQRCPGLLHCAFADSLNSSATEFRV